MMWNVAYTILVEVIPFIFIPIVTVKRIGHTTTICSNIKGILNKIIFRQRIIYTAGHDFDRPTVVFKAVFKNLYSIATFHKYRCCIFDEGVMLNMAICNVF